MEDIEELKSPTHNKSGTNMESQILWQHGQDLHEFAPDGVRELQEVEHAHNLNPDKYPIVSQMQTKTYLSSRECFWETNHC